MNELIIEGLGEEDIKKLYQIICKYPVTIDSDNISFSDISDLHNKLAQIIVALRETK